MDLSGDWQLIDDPISVTLASKTAEGTWAAPASVASAQRTAVTKEDVATNPALLEKDSAAFHLWAAKLAGAVPKIGDKLAYAGVTWNVVSVGEMDRDANGVQRFRCLALKSKAA